MTSAVSPAPTGAVAASTEALLSSVSGNTAADPAMMALLFRGDAVGRREVANLLRGRLERARRGFGGGELTAEPALFGHARLGEARQQLEHDRGQEEGEDGSKSQAADDDKAQRVTRFRSSAASQNERNAAQHRGDHGHDHRPQADEVGV